MTLLGPKAVDIYVDDHDHDHVVVNVDVAVNVDVDGFQYPSSVIGHYSSLVIT